MGIGRLFDSNNNKNNVLISSGNLNTIIKSLGVKKFDENAKNTYNKCEDFKAVFHSRNKLAKGMNKDNMNKNNMKKDNMNKNNMNKDNMKNKNMNKNNMKKDKNDKKGIVNFENLLAATKNQKIDVEKFKKDLIDYCNKCNNCDDCKFCGKCIKKLPDRFCNLCKECK